MCLVKGEEELAAAGHTQEQAVDASLADEPATPAVHLIPIGEPNSFRELRPIASGTGDQDFAHEAI
jgi:hypothetical protein